MLLLLSLCLTRLVSLITLCSDTCRVPCEVQLSDALLRDDDPLLQAGPRAGLQEGRPQVGGDGAGGQVGAVEPHVHLRLEPSRLVLDTVARALK